MTNSSKEISKIGAELTVKSDEVISHCTRLRTAIGNDDYEKFLQPLESFLNDVMVSVAFVGQVKAGKTTLLNSLIEKPDFLPSDVNPWTAVVTKLFFGRPDGQRSGAKFTFFNEEKWAKFSKRGGRLGEIAADIPESAAKLTEIRVEIDRMQARAKKTLGENFHALMGGGHDFNEATSDILARYICAGDVPDGPVRGHLPGRFADITQDASVFFEREKFGFPMVLVDTPGLNDPLLIREEITLQNLEHSQIFVLVLSAHQAFSRADLYLLRILNSLRLDRLIVFVNRVDELSDPENDIPEIRKHVTKMLEAENPGADIPIIFGSAAFANLALDLSKNISKPVAAVGAIEPRYLDKSHAKFSEPQRAELWAASGLPELEDTISQVLQDGPGETWLKRARKDLEITNNLVLSSAESHEKYLEKQSRKLSGEDPVDSDSDSSPLDVSGMKKELEVRFNGMQNTLGQAANFSFPRIRAELQRIVDEFIIKQNQIFVKYQAESGEKKHRQPWRCDTTPLRSEMNRYFRQEYPEIQEYMLHKLESEISSISTSLSNEGVTGASSIYLNTAEFSEQTPTTTALSKMVSFDMEPTWWNGWISKFTKQNKAPEELGRMIRKQFLPIQEELLNTALENLLASAKTALGTVSDMQNNLLELVKQENEARALSAFSEMGEVEAKKSEVEQLILTCKQIEAELAMQRGK